MSSVNRHDSMVFAWKKVCFFYNNFFLLWHLTSDTSFRKSFLWHEENSKQALLTDENGNLNHKKTVQNTKAKQKKKQINIT